ncbi:hypothetical protein SAMN05192574_105128 [Mucilaginibacter gossypiicola]|uniref:Uncharacterized protein n=1 Tax=Mucilaginibacter gossypiicola TaxID=551995 RepID=A0A1H8LKS5_9SPHI|nr:hypothetical protein SAMN05192574_105128 [Mucilaginibacter gossypiicola]
MSLRAIAWQPHAIQSDPVLFAIASFLAMTWRLILRFELQYLLSQCFPFFLHLFQLGLFGTVGSVGLL